MQKHRFNVRLGSGVSSGERKKLVRTARMRETEIRGGEEAESHPPGLRSAGYHADGALRVASERLQSGRNPWS